MHRYIIKKQVQLNRRTFERKYKSLNDNQKTVLNIINKMMKDKRSELRTFPVSWIYQIFNRNIYCKIADCITIVHTIDGKKHLYEIDLPEYFMRHIRKKFARFSERRRIYDDKEIMKGINSSLHDIQEQLNNF